MSEFKNMVSLAALLARGQPGPARLGGKDVE